MAQTVEVLAKKIEEIKLDGFFGEDLPLEKKFLQLLIEEIGKNLQDCEVSYYLSKKSMTLGCETFLLTKETSNLLLETVDEKTGEHFFQNVLYQNLVGALIIILIAEL